eukprot:gene18884-20785_t
MASFYDVPPVSSDEAIERLKNLIIAVQDFPKPGILFRDIMPIFKHPAAVTSMVDLMAAYIEVAFPDLDVIAGLDARGFLIGPMVANESGKPFVPIRKGGKLPGKVISRESVKEYGKDVLDIQADAISPGDKVLILDDLLATGGTLQTSCELVKQAKGEVIGCLCLVELEGLKGREKLQVERIAGRRLIQGREEFLVFWKGYDSYSASWEPKENLTFCKKVIQQFVSKILPIPGGIPCCAPEVIRKTRSKAKTISVKMLLTKRQKQSKSKSLSHINNMSDGVLKSSKSRKFSSESERLIRDTLLHESKSMKPKHASPAIVNEFTNHNESNKHISRKSINGLVKHYQDGGSRKRKSYCIDETENEFNIDYEDYLTEKIPSKNRYASKQTLRDSGEGDHIICKRENNYMKITLNNTARHNVLTTNMMGSLMQCLQSAQKDAEISAVLLCNNSDHFCSGVDYSELIECDDKQYKEKATEICNSLRSLIEALIKFSKPIMTAVNGFCMGFGIVFLVLGDLCFTSSRTSFELTSAKLDLTPIGCLTYLLPKVVGPVMANSMIYLGESYRATAAYDRGLINDIYGIHSFQEDIEKRLNQLIAKQPQTLEKTKVMLRQLELETLRDVCDSEMKIYKKCLLSEQCRRKLRQDWTLVINLYGSG